MKTMIKIEFERAFKNKWLYITLLFCIAFVVYDLVTEVIPTRQAMKIYINEPSYPIPNLFNRWMELNNSTAKKLLHFVYPLLISIPYSMSIYSDIKSRYINNIIIRMDKKKYFMSKLIVQFAVGFTVVLFTLVLSFVLTAAILPAGVPFAGCYYTMGPLNILGRLFYQYPLFVCMIIMLAQSLVFALIGCLTYTFAYILNNGVMVITSAFTVYFFEHIIMPLFGDNYNLLNNSYVQSLTDHSLIRLLLELIVIVTILIITYWVRSKAKDEL